MTVKKECTLKSGFPTVIPDICQNCYEEEIFHMTDCHVEKFLHMRNVKKIYHIEKVLHMINVEQNVLCGEMWRNLSCGEMCYVEKCCKQCCFVAKSLLSQFTLFVAKSVLSRFTRFLCGENLNQKLCLWRKKDKYQVWFYISFAVPFVLYNFLILSSFHFFKP